MKLLIALSCFAVAFAFPSSPGMGYRNDERNKINELDLSHEDLQSNDLIKAYEQLIGNIGRLSRADEEEDIVNNIIEAIIAIGQIITENRPPIPHRPGQEGGNIHNITRPGGNATERPTGSPTGRPTGRPTGGPTGGPTGTPTETPGANEINTTSPEITSEIPSSPDDISSGSNEINEDSLEDEETYSVNEPIIERRYRFPSVYEMK